MSAFVRACVVVLLAVGPLGCSSEDKSGVDARREPAAESRQAVSAAQSPSLRVVVLGSGTPVPDPERAGPSLAVVTATRAFLVDAGTGVVRRAAAAFERGIGPLQPTRLTHLFLTHLHSDHTLGLADVMLTPAVVGRREALRIWGPPGIAEMVERLRAAYSVDMQVRARAEGASAGYAVEPKAIDEGDVYRDDQLRVQAFRVPHGSFAHAFGYRFESAERVVVVSGDTGPSEAVVRACDGCDLLVHEVYCEAGLRDLPSPVQAYHRSFHTSGPQLAALASRARARAVLLTHLLPFGCSGTELLDEVREGFAGSVALAEDLGVY